MSEKEPETARPVLRIVKGDPSPQELAALIAVVTAASAGTSDPAPASPRSGWADPAVALRPDLHPGPGAWIGSTRARERRTRADW